MTYSRMVSFLKFSTVVIAIVLIVMGSITLYERYVEVKDSGNQITIDSILNKIDKTKDDDE